MDFKDKEFDLQIQIKDKESEVKGVDKQKRQIARLMGKMLYRINSKKDKTDLDAFRQINSIEEILERAEDLLDV